MERVPGVAGLQYREAVRSIFKRPLLLFVGSGNSADEPLGYFIFRRRYSSSVALIIYFVFSIGVHVMECVAPTFYGKRLFFAGGHDHRGSQCRWLVVRGRNGSSPSHGPVSVTVSML